MATTESYPCYVKVGDDDESIDNIMELPTENDGSILLSTLKAQFPFAIGMRYKSETGAWRGLRLSDDVIDPPPEGWGNNDYFITSSKQDGVKRKIEQSPSRGPEPKVIKTGDVDYLSDLIVLGLTYSASENELKEYFEQFGELAMHEIKRDPQTGKSKGFGFIRYKTVDAAKEALNLEHTVAGRKCEVRLPKKRDEKPLKLFIGRLKKGTTADHLRDHFCKYGELKDVYVPNNFRGFGFVTFATQAVARQVMNTTHIIEGSCINITYAEPKSDKNATKDSTYDFNNMRQSMHGSYEEHQSGNSTNEGGSGAIKTPGSGAMNNMINGELQKSSYWNNR